MHSVFIDKKITLDNIISDINLINILDNINYLNRDDGILIKGNLYLECQYISLGIIKDFKDKVEINTFIPKENISNTINMKMDDFDYYINNNQITFSFKMNIEGYKEIDKPFQSEIEEVEIVSNVDVKYDDIKELLDENNSLIVLDSPIIKTSIINEQTNNEELLIEENNHQIKENVNVEGERLVFNINGNEEKEVFVDNKNSIHSLFKKDKKKKIYHYHVILEDDTYEEIAKTYNVNLYNLKTINNNKQLQIGNILRIPLKK